MSFPVDMGMAVDTKVSDRSESCYVEPANMTKEPAMTREQASAKALEAGIEMVQ